MNNIFMFRINKFQMVPIEKILNRLDFHILRVMSQNDMDADYLNTLISSREIVKAEVDRIYAEKARRAMFDNMESRRLAIRRAEQGKDFSLKEIMRSIRI